MTGYVQLRNTGCLGILVGKPSETRSLSNSSHSGLLGSLRPFTLSFFGGCVQSLHLSVSPSLSF